MNVNRTRFLGKNKKIHITGFVSFYSTFVLFYSIWCLLVTYITNVRVFEDAHFDDFIFHGYIRVSSVEMCSNNVVVWLKHPIPRKPASALGRSGLTREGVFSVANRCIWSKSLTLLLLWGQKMKSHRDVISKNGTFGFCSWITHDTCWIGHVSNILCAYIRNCLFRFYIPITHHQPLISLKYNHQCPSNGRHQSRFSKNLIQPLFFECFQHTIWVKHPSLIDMSALWRVIRRCIWITKDVETTHKWGWGWWNITVRVLL